MTRYRFDTDSLNRTFAPLVMAVVVGSGVVGAILLLFFLLLSILTGSETNAR